MDLNEIHQLIKDSVKNLIDDCPHCGAKVHIKEEFKEYHTYINGDLEYYIMFRCVPCEKLLLKSYLFKSNPYHENIYEEKGWNNKFPLSLDSELNNQELEYVPEEVVLDYTEALKCKSIGANKASCTMFRRALQNGLIKLGANKNDYLIIQINSLKKLPEDIKDWSHHIRILGNWGAHPDDDNLKEVNKNDVEDVYDFISKFIMYMFIMPNKIKKSRKKREKKINQEQ